MLVVQPSQKEIEAAGNLLESVFDGVSAGKQGFTNHGSEQSHASRMASNGSTQNIFHCDDSFIHPELTPNPTPRAHRRAMQLYPTGVDLIETSRDLLELLLYPVSGTFENRCARKHKMTL